MQMHKEPPSAVHNCWEGVVSLPFSSHCSVRRIIATHKYSTRYESGYMVHSCPNDISAFFSNFSRCVSYAKIPLTSLQLYPRCADADASSVYLLHILCLSPVYACVQDLCECTRDDALSVCRLRGIYLQVSVTLARLGLCGRGKCGEMC